MTTVNIKHADGGKPFQIIAEDGLVFDQDRPVDELNRWFGEQAKAITDAMIKHLPGGTLGRVAANLMQHFATSFVVPIRGRPTAEPADSEAAGYVVLDGDEFNQNNARYPLVPFFKNAEQAGRFAGSNTRLTVHPVAKMDGGPQ